MPISLTWLFGFSSFSLFVDRLLGYPSHPAQLLWALLIAESFSFSFVGGCMVHLLNRSNRRLAHLTYLAALLVVVLSVCFILGGVIGVFNQFRSAGFWALLLGAVIAFAFTNSGMHLSQTFHPDR